MSLLVTSVSLRPPPLLHRDAFPRSAASRWLMAEVSKCLGCATCLATLVPYLPFHDGQHHLAGTDDQKIGPWCALGRLTTTVHFSGRSSGSQVLEELHIVDELLK